MKQTQHSRKKYLKQHLSYKKYIKLWSYISSNLHLINYIISYGIVSFFRFLIITIIHYLFLFISLKIFHLNRDIFDGNFNTIKDFVKYEGFSNVDADVSVEMKDIQVDDLNSEDDGHYPRLINIRNTSLLSNTFFKRTRTFFRY